eukprot:scaffold32335_cov119-Isochrysis_galbana.AAC.2
MSILDIWRYKAGRGRGRGEPELGLGLGPSSASRASRPSVGCFHAHGASRGRGVGNMAIRPSVPGGGGVPPRMFRRILRRTLRSCAEGPLEDPALHRVRAIRK